jgi:hypothetical protein
MRGFEQAKAFAIAQHQNPSRSWYNCCQIFARQCVGAPSFGASARLAFNGIASGDKHDSFPPPPGSIAYYGFSDHGSGHAVFVVEGGQVWSNDIIRHGQIDRVRWDVFHGRWGLPYRGWIDSCPAGSLPVQRAAGGGLTFRQRKLVYRSKMHLGQDDSDSVWNLQVALHARGLLQVDPTGYYGRLTLAACSAFQRRQGWTGRNADGVAGPETVRRLGLSWVAK